MSDLDLVNLLRKERKAAELLPLEPGFYKKVGEYLAELEREVRERPAQLVAEAEAQAKTRQDRIDEDLEVRKIRVMTSKAEVQEYALINFGVEFKPDMHLKEMKRLAVEERTKIIFANG